MRQPAWRAHLSNYGAEWLKLATTGTRLFYSTLVDFIFPPFCILCNQRLQALEHLVCTNCWTRLPILLQQMKIYPENTGSVFRKSLSVWEYSNKMQDLIHHFKYYGKSILGERMGHAMAELLNDYEDFLAASFLIPVPLHRRKLRERGYNQSAILARVIARATGLPVLDRILKRTRYTRPQAQLDSEARIKNVLGAFEVQPNTFLPAQTIILVDDVLTTGSTLNECAKVLKFSGVQNVYALTIARA